MPWFITTLRSLPSHSLSWFGREGRRLLDALQYIHENNYVHMDVKASNVFIDSDGHWFWGDFGSCKPLGAMVTSSTTQFCFCDPLWMTAHPKYDYFMFLLMLLIETLEDRKLYRSMFYESINAAHASVEIIQNSSWKMKLLQWSLDT